MNLLRLSIHTTDAAIGIKTQNARQEIKSPPGILTIDQNPPQMSIHSEDGDLYIDQSDAWAAYGLGGNLRWQNQIYSHSKQLALRGIARIVEEGKRMADILSGSAIADLARDWRRGTGISYVEPASYFGVKVSYTPHPTEIEITPQPVEIHFEPQKPIVQYTPGDVQVYVKQKESIDIRVSQYDWYS